MVFSFEKSYSQSNLHFILKKVDQITDSIFQKDEKESEFFTNHLVFIIKLRKINDSTFFARINFIFNSSQLKYHDFNYISIRNNYIGLYDIDNSFTEIPLLRKFESSDTIPLMKRLNTDPVSYIHSSDKSLRVTFKRNHPFEHMPMGSDSNKMPILSPFLIRIEKW